MNRCTRLPFHSRWPTTTAGQEPDRLNGDVSQTGVEVFAFQLSNSTGATVTLNGFVFQLSVGQRPGPGGFRQFLHLCGCRRQRRHREPARPPRSAPAKATTAISGATGTITFSGCDYDIAGGTTVKMVLTGDLANLVPGDSFTIDLGPGDLTPAGTGSDCTTTAHVVDGSTNTSSAKRSPSTRTSWGRCSADLTDFPLLVTLTGSDFAEVAAAAGAEGYDIIFKDADGNQLDHEIETLRHHRQPPGGLGAGAAAAPRQRHGDLPVLRQPLRDVGHRKPGRGLGQQFQGRLAPGRGPVRRGNRRSLHRLHLEQQPR